MKKLATDNPFFEFMGNVGDWILLNLLFVLTSIPVVTVGMSLTALYRIVLRRMRERTIMYSKNISRHVKKSGKRVQFSGLFFFWQRCFYSLIWCI